MIPVRGYPDNLVNNEMDKGCFSESTSKGKSQESKSVPLIITFHLKFKSIGK